jgi:3-phosphoshikimate 1-carboxyvinyltransferase
VDAGPDFIEVRPIRRWRHAAIRTYDDHRMAMCASLAAFNGLSAGAQSQPVPVRVLDPGCVAKTFPAYFDTLFSVARAHPRDIPVITVDGPTASGKGTLASELATALGYHHLDSGSLYRATALAAQRHGIGADDEAALAAIARSLPLRFRDQCCVLDGEDISDAIRAEAVGSQASQISALPAVRAALLELQLSFRRLPGLVADGRDMGTVVFPDAPLKVFLTASAQTRADRRYKQLISKGIPTKLPALLADLEARDHRDKSRSVAPLKPAEDAQLLDNSELTIESSVERVLEWWQQRQKFEAA